MFSVGGATGWHCFGKPGRYDALTTDSVRHEFGSDPYSDPMILPRYSHLITGLLPDATVKIYPGAAHGFLFQHHEEFAADVVDFLGGR